MEDTGEALGKDSMGEDELSVVATGERVLGRVRVLSMVDTGGQEPGVGREASGEDVLSMVDTGDALGKDAMGEDELSVVATGEKVLGRVGVLSMVDTGG